MHASEKLSYSGIGGGDMADEDEHIPNQGSYTYTTPHRLHEPSTSPSAATHSTTTIPQHAYQPYPHSHNLYQSTSATPPSPTNPTTTASHDPHTLTDDLLNHDSTPTLSLSIPDLDTFFTAAYQHWKEGGLRGVIGGRLVSLAVLGFSVLFSSFLLLCVDWDAVVRCSNQQTALDAQMRCESVSVVTWRHLDNPNALTYVVGLYFALFSLYWLSHLVSFLYSLPTILFIYSFYRSHLALNDEAVVSMGWGDVLQRLEAVQERERLCVVKRLNGLDITNRIMRRDNYMIALVNAQLLDIQPLPSLRRLLTLGRYDTIHDSADDTASHTQSAAASWAYGTMLDSIVRLCVIDCLFSSDFRLSPSFTSPNAGRWLQRRFVLFGVLTAVFLPFLFLFFVLLFVLRHAEELHTKKSLSSSRQWSLLSQWRLREYNELPHFFQRRLSLASLHASAYIEQFPAVLTSLLASAIAYCAAAVVGVLLLLGASGGVMATYVMERSLWWWLAVFSALLAISRSFIHTPPSVSPTATSPALTFASLVSYTHYHPRQWRGREHTAAVMRDVAAMYSSRATLFAQELAALLACPLVLLWGLAQRERCEQIVRYVQRVSVEVKGVGVVCQMARFELAADVGEEDNVEDEAADGGVSGRKQKADGHAKKEKKRRRRRRVNKGKEGKMEKSFLSFVINHQHWKLGQHDDEETAADTQQQRSPDAGSPTHGREQFLLSIAEAVKEADDISELPDAQQLPQHASQQYALQQRRTGRTRLTHEHSRSGKQRQRRRGTSVDSLDSVSSNESLSASPVRSSRQSVDDDDEDSKYEHDEKETPLQSPSHSIAPHALSASDRHLLVSFADLLNVAGAATAGKPWLAPPMLQSSTSSLLMQRSTAGLAGQRSMLAASQLGGGRVGLGVKRSVWEERMEEEMKASVSDRVREKMFSVLEKRVEEEEEAEEADGRQGSVEEEDDTRLDGDVMMAVDVPTRAGRRGAGDVEMRRILEPTQRLPQYQSIA